MTGDIRQEETEQERTIKEYLGKGREHFLGGENQQAIGIFEKLVKDEYIIKRYPNYYIEALSSLVLAYDREANLETTQLLFTKPDSRFTENAQKNLHKILDIFDKHESICSSDNILVLVRVLVEVINLKQILLEDETKKEFVKNLCERIPEYGESQELLGKINSSQAKFFFQKAIEIYIRKNQNNSAKRCQKKLNKMTEKPLIIFSNKLKLLIIIIAVFTILSFTAGIVFAVIMALPNSLSIHSENVKIKGNYLLSDESIREILPLSSSPSIFRIQPRALETDLLDKLPIDSAVVIRQIFPPALTIEVTERLPVAIALNSEEGNQKLLGFLDSKGKIIVSEKLPNLKVIGLPEQYRYDWQKMYESLMIYQGVIIYEIDWQNADNIILTTEIGLVHLGYNNALFQEQLRVLEKMKEEDKRANNLSYIDLTDPSNPKIVDFSNIDSEYSPSNTTLNFNTK
ncbi:cell division protein FtsQ [Arthrospira platensis C1]|nr:cell division protein FtsQ [Arthrospira platensis C1]